MAIPDLLWACPKCGKDRGLAASRRGFRCEGCGTTYRRGPGAAIRAERGDGTIVERTPAEWVDRLKGPEAVVKEALAAGREIRSARVGFRRVIGFDPVHDRSGYLNRIEIWGQESQGVLRLQAEALVCNPAEGGRGPTTWPLETLTAVQASSRSLQINRRDAALTSFRFHDDSIFLWEQLLHAALQAFYRRTGKGEIVEFQPRIVTSAAS